MKFRALVDCYVDGTYRTQGAIFDYSGPRNENLAPFSDAAEGESAAPQIAPITPRRVRGTSPEEMLRVQMPGLPPVSDGLPAIPGAVPSTPPETVVPVAPPLPAETAAAPVAPVAPVQAAIPGVESVRLPSATPSSDDLIGTP